MYDLSIELPTDEIENLFYECDDDHAAVPSAVYQFNSIWVNETHRKHNEYIDYFVEQKTPAKYMAQRNVSKRTQGRYKCLDMDRERRKRYAHRSDPRVTPDYIQPFIDA